MNTLSYLASCSLLAGLSVACSSGGISQRVEADALIGLPPDRQAHIASLDQMLETAKGDKAKVEKDLALATYELERARQNRDLVSSRIDHMEGLKDAAETLGDDVRVADANHVLEGLNAFLEAHDEEIEWLEAEVDYYEVGVELQDARIAMADAAVQEGRAEAIHQADLPSKAEVPLEDYKIQVSETMSNAADLETKSARAWKVVQEEKRDFQEALARVPNDEAAEKKALAAEANKNREMADEMNSLRKQIDRLRNDNDRLQTTLATQNAGGGDAPALNPGGGATEAGATTGDDD